MTEQPQKKKFNLLVLLPPLITIGLLVMFYIGLKRDNPNSIPSQFIGQSAPAVNLTPLRADAAPVDADFRNGNIQLVNFWASWCAPCRAEAPMLEHMADELEIPIIGINYKDQPIQAEAFLTQFGDPFTKIGADASGRTAIEWGVTGVPETFILDGEGTILLRYPGPITRSVLTNRILPLLNGNAE